MPWPMTVHSLPFKCWAIEGAYFMHIGMIVMHNCWDKTTGTVWVCPCNNMRIGILEVPIPILFQSAHCSICIMVASLLQYLNCFVVLIPFSTSMHIGLLAQSSITNTWSIKSWAVPVVDFFTTFLVLVWYCMGYLLYITNIISTGMFPCE